MFGQSTLRDKTRSLTQAPPKLLLAQTTAQSTLRDKTRSLTQAPPKLLLAQTTAQLPEQVPKRQRMEHEKRPRTVNTDEDDSASEAQLLGPKGDQSEPEADLSGSEYDEPGSQDDSGSDEEHSGKMVAGAQARVSETEE